MNTEHIVTVGKVKTTFTLASMPKAARASYLYKLRLAETPEDREEWFGGVFYWLYEGRKTEGKKAQDRAGVSLAMYSPEFDSFMAEVTKDQKTMQAFYDKLTADEPEQKPAEETV